MHEGKMREMQPMTVKISRKHSTSRTTSAPRRRGRIYSERWDLSHLAENPVEHFETLVGEIESKVAKKSLLSKPYRAAGRYSRCTTSYRTASRLRSPSMANGRR